MFLNLWSILLIASLLQCLFLFVSVLIRPVGNPNARLLLLFMLAIIFCVQFSNFSEATCLYRSFHGITNLDRGMGLMLGPVLYLYTLSVMLSGFKFRYIHLLHFTPYLFALVIIWIQENSVNDRSLVLTIDALMEGKSAIDGKALLWFVAYFSHLTVYFFLTRRFLLQSVKKPPAQYRFPVELRFNWLRKFTIAYCLVALVFAGIIIYVAITGLYTVAGNFIYSMVLGVMIYTIAYQALSDARTLKSDFDKKYASVSIEEQTEEALLRKVLYFFEREKIYRHPEIKISELAKKAQTSPHVISRVINNRLNKSFSELVNYYRTEEVKQRLADPAYKHYSIMGIAMDVGFTSKSAFNEVFKKQNGMMPSQYLKMLEER